mmetsp:Transcript_36791/g.78421  ORF Transcript_36791/g.78421 Transcript_36791/m.78421 type:complete len:713 (+) Transcript_36791:203-2341(+)
MAWNGRNESILGAKAEVKDPAPAAGAPSKEAGDDNAKKGDATDAKKKPAPAPAPVVPSVWNGRHQKIIAVADKDAPGSETSSVASSLVIPPTRCPSPAISTTSSIVSKNKPEQQLKELVVISQPPKEDAKSGQQANKEKEDETTNSTAGSSIAKSIDGEPVEVKVVTTEVPTTASVSDKNVKDKKSSPEQGGAEAASAGAAPAPVKMRKSKSTESFNGRQKNNPKSKPNNGQNSANNTRRQGNVKGGAARGTNGNGNNNQQGNDGINNNARQNFARGNSTGSPRRRANNNNQADNRPLCSFFMRGMCNRGTSCLFKHDAAHAPSGACAPATSPLRRSGTHPPSRSPARSASFPAKRAFDPHKAQAIKLAKEAQDKEDRSSFASANKADVNILKSTSEEKKTDESQEATVDPPCFSIDVECIATGHGSCAKGINDGCGNEGRDKEGVPSSQYNDGSHRYPGRIAMVDGNGCVLADIIVRPPNDGAGVVSYLTPLTGLTAELCLGEDARSLEETVDIVKGLLPHNAVLVGQAIDHDVEWLGLVQGRDFGRMLDISEIFRQRMPSNLSQAANVLKEREEKGEATSLGVGSSSDADLGFPTRYRHFSLRHVCVNLLDEDIQSGVHDPVVDARYSLSLFQKYRNSSVTQLRIVRDGLHRAPITPSFSSEFSPVVDGVSVSAAAYPYKRAGRKIWRWYAGRRDARKEETIEQPEQPEN